MAVANPIPFLFMRGIATAHLREFCTVERNNGDGWEPLHISTPCNIQHIDYRPVPPDPADASTETGEVVAFHFRKNLPVRVGDRGYLDVSPTRKWVIGGGNITETNAQFQILRALRPTAATPYTEVVILRWDSASETEVALPPQTAQFVLSRRVPIQIGDATYIGGTMFGPEGYPPLDVEIGDEFRYNNMNGYVTWVTPSPSERREAVFELRIPTAWDR